MPKAIEVEIDDEGRVRPLTSNLRVPAGRALLLILDADENVSALLSETSLAKDWLSEEEDAAWAHLKPES